MYRKGIYLKYPFQQNICTLESSMLIDAEWKAVKFSLNICNDLSNHIAVMEIFFSW